jgi:S-DNA-T family DNA segregation ATPase FtsK/SpoIIIE
MAKPRKHKTKNKKPSFLRKFLSRYSGEIGGIVLLGLGLFATLSLLSYSALDPSFNTASATQIQNWLGHAGAYTSDFLLQSFGLPAWLGVIVLLMWGWRMLAELESPPMGLRLLLLPAGLLLTCAAAAALPIPQSWPFHAGLGGFVGQLIMKTAMSLTGLQSLAGMTVLGIAGGTAGLLLLALSTGLAREEWVYYGQVIAAVISYIGARIYGALAFIANEIKVLFGREPLPLVEAEAPKPAEKLELPKPPERKKREMVIEKTAPIKKPEAKQRRLDLDMEDFQLPSIDLLKKPANKVVETQSAESLEQNAKLLESVLNNYGVEGEVVKVRPGPVVTLYELEPSPGTRAARVIGLADDIARNMSTLSVRVASVPSRSVLGIELPNRTRETVFMRELLEIGEEDARKVALPLILGKDIGGSPIVADLARMPHLLIAGTTGSGKSVAINTMILSLLYR